jgi:hypothetical protein
MESNLGRIVEVYKARMTVGLTLMIGMTTVTGYALTSRQPVVFLVAAIVPVFELFCDVAIVWRVAVPFAYRAFVIDDNERDESVGSLFLAFGSPSQSELESIKALPPGISRQRAFRRFYVLRKLWLKGLLFVTGTVGEVALWIALR